jgi:transposase InsO family protein
LLPGYTRQAFYGHQKMLEQDVFETELVVQEVLKHRALQPRIGTRKLIVMLQDFSKSHHINFGRDALFSLLGEHGLLIRKRKRKAVTTNSKHWMKRYPNLIRGFIPMFPDTLWVSDITYVVVAEGFAYLSLITDAYSRKITGLFIKIIGGKRIYSCFKYVFKKLWRH